MARRSIEVRYEAITRGYDGKVIASSALTARFAGEIDKANNQLNLFGRSADRTGNQIDRLSGRVRILADAVAFLGPSLVPVGAVAVPAVAGLASQLGFASVAAGTAVLAFDGLGDALKAMNDAALDPTDAHLEKARITMAALSPEAAKLARQLHDLGPVLDRLQASAGVGFLPGVSRGLADLRTATPKVAAVLQAVGTELGQITENIGESVASGRWNTFLAFLADEAPAALGEMAEAAGNTAHALAELWMATTPVNQDFSRWLIAATEDLDRWATGLSRTEGFQEFINYIRTNGPQVADTFAAIGNAALQIVEAIAPLGGPSLQIIEALANALAALADSDLGTPLLAMVGTLGALNTAMRIYQGLQTAAFGGPAVAAILANEGALNRVGLSAETARSKVAGFSRGFAAIGAATIGLDLLDSGLDKLFDRNLDESKLGTGLRALASGQVSGEIRDKFGKDMSGLVAQVVDATRGGDAAFQRWAGSLPVIGKVPFIADNPFDDRVGPAQAAENIKALDKALADLVDGGQLDEASAAFGIIDTKLRLNGLSTEQVTDLFDEYQQAIEAAGASQGLFSTGTQKLTGNQVALAARISQSRQAAAEVALEFVGLGKSLDDSKVSLREWIGDLNEQAEALDRFADNAQKAADKGLREGLIKQLEAAGPAGALRMKQLANATDTEIARANQAWARGRTAIKRYTDAVGGVPAKVTTVVDARTADARRKIETLGAFLNEFLKRPRHIKITTSLENPGRPGGITQLLNQAVTPRRTSDAFGGIHYYSAGDIANRHMPELAGPGPTRVWREPETRGEAYIPLAADYRRPRAVDIWEKTGIALGVQFQRYAHGGISSSPAGGELRLAPADVEMIARALIVARPLHGDVHVTDGYGGFKKQMEQDRRTAGLGGGRPTSG